MAGKFMQPYQQGHLDPLCGVYAVLNAVCCCAPGDTLSSREDAEWLFARCIQFLLADPKRHRAFINGVPTALLLQLLTVVEKLVARRHGVLLTHRRPFYNRTKVPADQAIDAIRAHLRCKRAVVLTGYESHISHWTVIIRISRGRLLVADSDQQEPLDLRDVVFTNKKSGGYVAIPPSSIILVGSTAAALTPRL